MNTLDCIHRKESETKYYNLQFEILDSDDAIILNGKYNGMRLTQIFVVNPSFIQWLIDDNRFDADIKGAAKFVMENELVNSECVTREILVNAKNIL